MRSLALAMLILVVATPVFAQQGDPVETLATLLKKSQSPAAVAKAAADLAELGPKAAAAAPALVEALQIKNEDVRLNVALALGKIGEPGVKPLMQALKDADADVRFYAVWALAWIGPDAKEAGPEVIRLMADANDGVRRKAAYALGRINPEPKEAVAHLMKALGDKNADVQQAVTEALGAFGKAAVPGLIEALKDDQRPVQVQAMRALGNLGSEAKDAVPGLKAILLTADPGLSLAAAVALAKVGKEAVGALEEGLKSDNAQAALTGLQQLGAPAVPAIIDALGNPKAPIRKQAASILGSLNINDKSIVIALAHGIADDDKLVRIQCLNALQQMGFRGFDMKQAIPKILKALEHADDATQSTALTVLATVKGDADQVLPAVEKLATSPISGQRLLVVRVAGNYPPQGKALVLQGLKDTDINVRVESLTRLNFMPGDFKEILPTLREFVKDANLVVRRQAVQALGRAGEDALPDLVEILKSKDFSMRITALQGLQSMGKEASKAIPHVAKLAASEKNPTIRNWAIRALGGMGKEAVGPLIDLVKKEKVHANRVWLINSLGALGPDGQDAVPLLEDLAKSDPNPAIRNLANVSLKQIRAKSP